MKHPEIKMVGYSRPGLKFPETAVGFFDFFLNRMKELLVYGKLDDALVESAKVEGRQLLDIASDIYHLGVDRDFWEIIVAKEGPDSLTVRFCPRALVDYDVKIENNDRGSYTARSGEHFVCADSALEALAGLGRIIERRNSRTMATCTCGSGRGCLIH